MGGNDEPKPGGPHRAALLDRQRRFGAPAKGAPLPPPRPHGDPDRDEDGNPRPAAPRPWAEGIHTDD